MPVLPDGTYVDDETYAEMLARTGGSGIPTSGYDLGTDWSFAPATTGGGTVNLSWEQAPGLGATFNFDPSAGYENAFISDYDIAGQGMANIGDISSPDANLSLTAGLQGQGLSTPDPYIQAAVENVVPGFDVSTGTNIPSSATYSAGNLEDQGYSLDLSKVSGGPTQAAFTTELMGLPSGGGVNLNLGTGGGGSGGITVQGTPSDLGTLGRRVWGGITDALGNIISPAGAADEVPAVGTQPLGKYGPSGYMGAGMGTVPTVDVTDQLSYEMRYPGLYGDNLPDSGGVHDAIEHIDAIYGGVTTTSKKDEGLRTRWKDTVVPLLGLLPGDLGDTVIEKIMSTGLPGTGFTGDDIETAKSAESIKDVLNNMVIMDAKKSGVAKDDLVHSVLTGVNPLIQTNAVSKDLRQ